MSDEGKPGPCPASEYSSEQVRSHGRRLSEAHVTVKAYIEKMRGRRGPLNDTDATLLALAELVMDERG